MVAPSESWSVITSAQVDADSPLDETLMAAIRGNLIHLEEWLGDGYTAAKNHDHDTVNSAGLTLTGLVAQGDLKTNTAGGTTSSTNWEEFTLTGGTYSFYPQTKAGGSGATVEAEIIGSPTASTSFVTRLYLKSSSAVNNGEYGNRYVTASGKDHWVFALYDTLQDKIISLWESGDHPCYGQGSDESILPHPFLNYLDNSGNQTNLPPNCQIILFDNNEIQSLKAQRKSNLSICGLIHAKYKLDISPVKPIYKDREIVELDIFNEITGTTINTLKNGIKRKRRMVTGLPAMVEYRKLKLK